MSRSGPGRVLEVDVSTGSTVIEVQPGPRRMLGGGGALAAWLLLQRTEPGLSPDDPRSLFVLAGGPAAGLAEVGLSRCSVAAKSPLSGGLVESIVEGPFAHSLSALDLDGIVITGRADGWSYVVVDGDGDGDGATIHPADDLTELDTGILTDRLRARHGTDVHVAAIGPAAVNGVAIASVVLDRAFPTRAGGLGGVLAGKRVLAVVLAGTSGHDPRPAIDPARAASVTTHYRQAMADNALARTQYNDPGFGFWPGPGLEGYLGVENYRRSVTTMSAAADSAPASQPTPPACPGCPQNCLKTFPVAGLDARSSVLHQEAVPAFTANLGLDDVSEALEVNARCHLLGIEPVAFSMTLSAVLETRAEGRLPDALAGVRGQFGAVDPSDLLERLATGEPAIRPLGLGVAALARLHPEIAAYALHVGGVAMVGFDPRGSHGQALVYALNPSGPRYDAVEHDIDFAPGLGDPDGIARATGMGVPPSGWPMQSGGAEKAAATAQLWSLWSGYDALGLCVFASAPTRPLTEQDACDLVSAATGWNTTPAEIHVLGRRRLALQRLYNVREGLGADADHLPDRFFDQAVEAGRLAGSRLDRAAFTADLAVVRRELGWIADDGGPTTELLRGLELNDSD